MENIDLRIPIGILFLSLGILLVLYGFFSNPAIYEHTSGFNLNLTWGFVMGVFGFSMLAIAKLGKRR
jgi:hypothetical protein